MPLGPEQLRDLQSPFYRVAVKALIFDDQERLLLAFNEDDEAELPGGGWEHDESLETCLQREVDEELTAAVTDISPVQFVFTSQSDHGWRVLRVVVRARLASESFAAGDDMTDARFVTKQEFAALNFDQTDAPVKAFAGQIWAA
nr:NUDIX domain protein [uncultured bacterium]